MKKSVIAIALSLGLVAAPLAHAKKRTDQTYVDSFASRSDIPVPVSVVSPMISGEHAGSEVNLEFIVNAMGKPVGITTSSSVDRELAARLIRAVAQWRFAPARDAVGEPIARRVVLPMRIVAGGASARYAIR
jgi:hypothetical protein